LSIGAGIIWFWRSFAGVGSSAFSEICSLEFVLPGRPFFNRLVITSALTHGYIVSPGEFFLLGKGVFHATENIGETELHLIEVEIPRNKLDLVRAQDLYGRSGSSYEQKPLPSRIEPLQPCSRIPGARIRTTCLLSQYRFGVSSGAEIISSQQEQEDLLFFVPLRLMHAMKQTIRVFSEKTRVDENGVYLVISQTKRTEQGAQ
jgi:hypothetical protein